MSVQLQFRMVNMKLRFLDRPVADTLAPITRRFFMRAGGAIRTTARRSLRRARRKKDSELTEQERARHEHMMALWKARVIRYRPQRPEVISKPGKPPLLHHTNSLLKARLYFALSADSRSVVVGPEAVGTNKRIATGRLIVRGRQWNRGRVYDIATGPARMSDLPGLTSIEELEDRRPFMEPAFVKIQPRLPEFLRAATAGVRGDLR